MKPLRWSYLGCLEYEAARILQEQLAARLAAGEGGEVLLCLEHPPLFTLGRHAGITQGDRAAIEQAGAEVVRTDRGGGLTWHGPGQLVIYPVFSLRSAGRGVRRFVAALSQALAVVAREAGVEAREDLAEPGLFVGRRPDLRKLASIGLAVRRGVTLHGAALNLDARAEAGFLGLEPCGLAGVRATSLASESASLPASPGVFAAAVAEAFARRLNCSGALSVPPAAVLAGASGTKATDGFAVR